MADDKRNYKFKAEMKQLLNIIVNSLYKNSEVFLRELVSNASDALNKLRFKRLTDKDIRDSDLDLNIKIEVDKEKNTFSIEDTGIGMTRDDLINKIGTVASSGTLEYLEKIKAQGQDIDANLIGQFGVGFYSAFMVTDEITIDTLYADKNEKAYKWISNGTEKFTITEGDRQIRGTKISFKFKDEHKEFSDPERIKEILKKYSNFVDFPIYVNDEEINKIKPLWQKKNDEIKDEELTEFYKFITGDWQEPLDSLHLSIEGKVNFKALIFIPKTAPNYIFQDVLDKSLNLYSNKVFIQNDCKELLPDYLRFLRGVVDTEDLPLNVSREVTQSSPLIAKIKNIITNKILNHLQELAENNSDKYIEFYKTWGSLFKTGLNTDFNNKEKIIELLRFETSVLEKNKLKSLKEYVSTLAPNQKDIYYTMGDSREIIEQNPNLEYFRNKGIEVIYLFDPVDIFTFPYIKEYQGKQIISIDKADIKIDDDKKEDENEIPDEKKNSFLQKIQDILNDKVEKVIDSKRLVDFPATLVSGASALDPHMEKMLKIMDKDFSPTKKIFEVNLKHPIMKNLFDKFNKNDNNEIIELVIMQLYESSLMLEGNLNSPVDFIKRMNKLLILATTSK